MGGTGIEASLSQLASLDGHLQEHPIVIIFISIAMETLQQHPHWGGGQPPYKAGQPLAAHHVTEPTTLTIHLASLQPHDSWTSNVPLRIRLAFSWPYGQDEH